MFLVATLMAYVASTAFHMIQLLARIYVKEGVEALAPTVLPFRPCAVLDVLLGIFMSLAIINSDDGQWLYIPWLSALQIVAFVWSEKAVEWASILFAMCFVPDLLALSPLGWIFLNIVLAARKNGRNGEAVSAVAACIQMAAYFLRPNMVQSAICCCLSAEMIIYTLRNRLNGVVAERYQGIPYVTHLILEYIIGIRCVNAHSWSTYQSGTTYVIPNNLIGVHWRCENRFVVGRRLQYSVLLSDGRVQMPLAYWNEVAFAPNVYGAAGAILAGLRLPLTTRVSIVINEEGGVSLRQEDVVFLNWVVPEPFSRPFQQSLLPGSPCPSVTAVLVPTQLTLRRVTELFLTLAFLRHYQW